MKNLLILIVLIAAGYAALQKYRETRAVTMNPAEITAPVYAEMRVLIGRDGREWEMVVFEATKDEAECQRSGSEFIEGFMRAPKSDPSEQRTLKSRECKRELPPRYQRLFANQPSSLTYLSLARGAPHEREIRLIYWGMSVEESNAVCGLAPSMQTLRKGPVTCIQSTG